MASLSIALLLMMQTPIFSKRMISSVSLNSDAPTTDQASFLSTDAIGAGDKQDNDVSHGLEHGNHSAGREKCCMVLAGSLKFNASMGKVDPLKRYRMDPRLLETGSIDLRGREILCQQGSRTSTYLDGTCREPRHYEGKRTKEWGTMNVDMGDFIVDTGMMLTCTHRMCGHTHYCSDQWVWNLVLNNCRMRDRCHPPSARARGLKLKADHEARCAQKCESRNIWGFTNDGWSKVHDPVPGWCWWSSSAGCFLGATGFEKPEGRGKRLVESYKRYASNSTHAPWEIEKEEMQLEMARERLEKEVKNYVGRKLVARLMKDAEDFEEQRERPRPSPDQSEQEDEAGMMKPKPF
eukprot:gnl/MRDRNA2_/MRDRNA2_131038_c0_seq1.p1 gnl/MRDRNA2_/MRDRNA2_131038_c0~~gnl/MRDRNA2_/MRDRNA2_131038_c0_seq1.p1  ORF type:complete len:350 (-),score=47.50 gnl/MRDRNA2_/MRDRNA2_131038_c0_seq1:90-1139(-)